MLNKSKIPSGIYFVISFFLLFAGGKVNAQNLLSAENRLSFGNHLFCQHDYLRAIDEYRNFLKVENNDTVRFKIGIALQKIGQYNQACDNFKGLFFNSSLAEEAKLEFYKSVFLTNDFKAFRNNADQSIYASENYGGIISKLYQTSYLLDDLLPDSSKFINSFSKDETKEMVLFFNRKKNPAYKSSMKAALLSAVLPGLGKVYCDETGDGITAFLYTGILGFLAYNNFVNKHELRAWIFTGLAAYFYAGNIYGSIAAAQNYNVALNFTFDSDLNFYLKQKKYFIPQYNFICE